MIFNQFSMKRVDDNTPIAIDSADISADQGAWCWTFQGTIPGSEIDKIIPDSDGPVEVEITMNGISWRFWIESYDRKRTFGATDVTIRGRSVTAQLDAPYAPPFTWTSDNDYYTKALAQYELDRIPGPTWGLDFPDLVATHFRRKWDAEDGLGNGWLVPELAYFYANRTPMASLNAIAASVGAYVQSHKTDPTVIFNSGAPKGFWDWSTETPDLILPKALVMSDSLQWTEKPQYNRGFVTGRLLGINALVTRTAFTPDIVFPQYINDLIVTEEAAREMGKTIISSGGKQARVSLEIPLDPTIGLTTLDPGMLVKVTNSIEGDWYGLTRSLAVNAKSENKSITIHQTVQLERHY